MMKKWTTLVSFLPLFLGMTSQGLALPSVDCLALCSPQVCQLENFKTFCRALCKEEEAVKKCQIQPPMPFILNKGKLETIKPAPQFVAAVEAGLKAFCLLRCTADDCGKNKGLAQICVDSCVPGSVTKCQAAAGL